MFKAHYRNAVLALTLMGAGVTSNVLLAQEPEAELSEEAAQAAWMEAIEEAGWEREGVGKIGTWGAVAIPEGYRFTGRKGTAKVMEMMGNPPSDSRLAMISPEGMEWFVVFDFDKVGYVKDDEKDSLDADKILKDKKESSKISNEMREREGYGRLDVVGWAYPPTYNEQTNNLEWALELKDDGGELVVNYQTKILGRDGVMNAILVCGPDELDGYLPEFQSMLSRFGYKDGKKYADYVKGDKMAEYGLAGLIAGGTIFAAAKTGILAKLVFGLKKFWIFILVAIAGAFRWLKGLFVRERNY